MQTLIIFCTVFILRNISLHFLYQLKLEYFTAG